MKTMKLIDADALYNGAMKNEYFQFKESDKTGREAFAYSCAMERLVEAPAVDAAPVIHAKWIYGRNTSATCSHCHRTYYDAYDLDNSDRYCRGCGAKMDE